MTDEGPDPDTALMLAVRAGDERAFATLVSRWQSRIVSLAFRYLRSAADAEDLAQEVFLRVFRAKESYEPSARFATWIYRITANASLNYIRGRKARRAISGGMAHSSSGDPDEADEHVTTAADPAAVDPADLAEKEELSRVLRGIVNDLPDRQRLAILLNKYQGLSYEECAESMELSVMALKSLLTRARVAIKEKLVPYIESGALPEPGVPENKSRKS